jgi:TonB family protein
MKTLRTSLSVYCLAVLAVAVSLLAFAPGAFGQEVKPLTEGEGATKSAATPAPAQSQADGPVDYSRPFSPKDVTKKSRILFRAEPEYTAEAKTNEIEGTVVLRAVLDSSGKVTGIRAVSGLPYGLTEKAIEAAHTIKFEPAVKDGHKVSQYIQIEYNFTLYRYENDPTVKTGPVILEKLEPLPTDEARGQKVHGRVVLEVLFTPLNGARVLRVIQGLPYGLIEQSIAAAEKIKYLPAVSRRGNTISVIRNIEYKFKL